MSWWILAAIAASIVASQVLGMLWYGTLFGKAFMQEMGWEKLSKKQLEEHQKGAMPGYLYSAGIGAIATALLWVILVVWDFHGLAMSDLNATAAGALLALVGFLTFYVPGTSTSVFFGGPSWRLWGIHTGYWGIMAVLWGTFAGAFSTL